MSDVLRYTLETGLCLTLFYAGYWLFLRKETCFSLNRIYLAASIVLSFIIPAAKVPSPFVTIPVTPAPLLGDFPALSLPARSIGLSDILFWVYAAGAAFFLAGFACQLIRLYLVVRKNGSRDLGGLKFVSVDKDFAPFSFLKYVFINGPSFDPDNLRHILAHERAHVRQGHSLDILLIEGATVLQWFNPIVRPYKRSIQETHEFLADGEVVAQGFNSARYQLILLEQQVGCRLLEFSSDFKQSQIKRRILMMSHARTKGAARLKVLLLLPLAVLLVLALAHPRPIVTADHAPVAGVQEQAGPGPADQDTKDLLAKVTENLALLKSKEADLQKALESTSDPNKRADLKASLEFLLKLHKSYEAYLQNPDSLPPPPPLPPPVPEGKSGLKMLRDKEATVEKALASATDPEEVQKLKETLEEVQIKERDLEVRLGREGIAPPLPPPAPNSEAGLDKLIQKQVELQMMMASAEEWKKMDEVSQARIKQELATIMARVKTLRGDNALAPLAQAAPPAEAAPVASAVPSAAAAPETIPVPETPPAVAALAAEAASSAPTLASQPAPPALSGQPTGAVAPLAQPALPGTAAEYQAYLKSQAEIQNSQADIKARVKMALDAQTAAELNNAAAIAQAKEGISKAVRERTINKIDLDLLNKMAVELQQKDAEIRAVLAKTQAPRRIEELNSELKELLARQAALLAAIKAVGGNQEKKK